MNYFAAVEIGQAMQHSLRNFAQHLLARSATQLFHLFVDTVEAATFAKFHGYRDCAGRFVHECPIVLTDMIGSAVFVEIQLAKNLFLDVGIRVGSDDLVLSDLTPPE